MRGQVHRLGSRPPAPWRPGRRRGLLLDLDGVLWDTTAVHQWAFAQVCLSAALTPLPYGVLAGRPTSEAWELVLKANDLAPEAEKVRWLTDQKQRLARNRIRARPPLRPDLGAIAALAHQGAPLGLVSGGSAETVDIFLEASGLPFDVVVTASSGCPGKPAPDPFLLAATTLGLKPAECWALEDSAQGLHSAWAAGARTVHLAGPGGPCPAGHSPVHACVADLAEFAGLVGAGATC